MRELPVVERQPAAYCCAPLSTTGMSGSEAESTAALFKALADPHRVRILNLLANSQGPVCVCDFTPELGLSQPTVSFHLKKLVGVGLLHREQRGTYGYYSVDRDALRRLGAVFEVNESKEAS